MSRYTEQINSLTQDLESINQSLTSKEVGEADTFSGVAEKIRAIETGGKEITISFESGQFNEFWPPTFVDNNSGNTTSISSTGSYQLVTGTYTVKFKDIPTGYEFKVYDGAQMTQYSNFLTYGNNEGNGYVTRLENVVISSKTTKIDSGCDRSGTVIA